MRIKRVILTLFLCISLVFSTAILGHAYSGILAFGDSLSDNGIKNQYAVAYANPIDSWGFQRYSNGPVLVEYLAQDLGVPLLDMAYGGATTGLGNPAANLSITGLQWQVTAYQGTFGSISGDTLVSVWAGGNDMFNYNPILDPFKYSPLYASQNIALAIQNLITLGGDSFLIPNLPIYNPWEAAFDPALAAVVAGLRLANPGVNFYELDLSTFVPTGIDFYDGTYLAQTYGPGVYAWWDQVGVHPTTQVHEQIAAYAATRIPEPASIILLIIGLAGLVGVRRRMKF